MRSDVHAAKLENLERFAKLSGAYLAKKNGTAAGELDRQRYDREERRNNKQSETGGCRVKNPLSC
jgi:hypothetical protein